LAKKQTEGVMDKVRINRKGRSVGKGGDVGWKKFLTTWEGKGGGPNIWLIRPGLCSRDRNGKRWRLAKHKSEQKRYSKEKKIVRERGISDYVWSNASPDKEITHPDRQGQASLIWAGL